MVVVILATLAPSLIQDSDSIQFMPRTTYVFATLLGVFLAVVVYYYHKVVSYTSGLVAIWLACTCYQTYGITQSLYIVNFMDARRAESIANEVDQIKSKGLDPNQLVFVKLNNTMSTYPGVFTVRDLNITSYYVAWASAQTYCTFANCNRLTTNNETRDISFEDAVKDIQDNTLIRKASSGDVLYVQDNTVYVLTR